MRLARQRRVKGDNVTDPQQIIKGEILNSGTGRAVKGNNAPPEGPQPLHDSGPDPPGPDNADGEIPQFFPASPKPEVPGRSPRQNGLEIPHSQEHQHQGVVGNTAGRVGNIPDGNPKAGRVLQINVVVPNAPSGEIANPDARKSPKHRRLNRSLVPNTDTPMPGSISHIAVTKGTLDKGDANPKPRGHLPNQDGLIALTPEDSNTGRSSHTTAKGSHGFALDHGAIEPGTTLSTRIEFPIHQRQVTHQ